MAQPITVAEYIEKAIDLSGKTQREIALEAGFERPNVLSMMKKGITKVPIDRIPALAQACGVDAATFLRIAMNEYNPETWRVISKHLGQVTTDDECHVLDAYRKWRDTTGHSKTLTSDDLDVIFETVG